MAPEAVLVVVHGDDELDSPVQIGQDRCGVRSFEDRIAQRSIELIEHRAEGQEPALVGRQRREHLRPQVVGDDAIRPLGDPCPVGRRTGTGSQAQRGEVYADRPPLRVLDDGRRVGRIRGHPHG